MSKEVKNSGLPENGKTRRSSVTGLNERVYPAVDSSSDFWESVLQNQVVSLPETEEKVFDGKTYTFVKSPYAGVEVDYSEVQTTWERIGGRPSNEEILEKTVRDRDGGRVAFNPETFRIEAENPGFHSRCASNGRAK